MTSLSWMNNVELRSFGLSDVTMIPFFLYYISFLADVWLIQND